MFNYEGHSIVRVTTNLRIYWDTPKEGNAQVLSYFSSSSSFEDVDFCLRAKRAGFKVTVEPGSVIIHQISEKANKPFKQHLMALKSNFIFIREELPFYWLPIAYSYLVILFFKVIIKGLK